MSFANPAFRLSALGLAGSLAALSCSPQSPSDPEQTLGAVRVEVSTSGSGVPASFSVTLDGGSARTISPDGATTFSSLTPGGYTVQLSVPANCSISGAASRSVTVRESITSDVSFSVTCTAVPTGAIGVTTATTGDPPDPDGYSLTVDGSPGPSIGTNATALIPDLTVGDHEIGLTGAADNCAVQDANPRTVPVNENQTTQVEFDIVCSATTGLIDVSVTTTGDEPDTDGYTIDLDGTASQSVAANGSTTFTGVEEGGHTLTLEDVAPNCAVDGDNPVSADVVAGQTTDVSFTVTCAATVGSLEVSASTSGSQQDPNGYAVSVDGGPEQSLGVNGSTSFEGLGPGLHDVELTDVAANCAVAGDNPRSVDVTAGQTASTTFDVTCSSTVGSIEVTVATTGEAIDPDGYSVVLDGGADTQLVDANDVITFGGLAPGEHTLTLQNVAENCAADDDQLTADVVAGETAQVTFSVTCAQLTGDIQVNVTTSGSDPDPDGYDISLDGGSALSIGINGSRTFQDVVIGEHEIELSDVATNCAVQGDNPRSVTVNEDQITQVNISVECSSTTGQITVSVTTTGDDFDTDGYTVNRDGVVSQPVSVNGSTTFTGVPPGSSELTLQNIADNCQVTSANPQTTSVSAGGTSNVSFSVECSRTTGDVRVTTSSSGSPADANGYTVSVDGDSRSIGINDTELFADLQPDSYTVSISGVATQCEVSGSTTRNVNVTADQVTDVQFTVTCDPLEGEIQVNVSTSGEDQDDGYTVLLDGGSARNVGPDGSTTYTSVPTGSHQITLDDIAINCSVSGSNPRSVTVMDEQTSTVNFSVTCTGLTGDLEVTTSTSGEDLPAGYTVEVDGGMSRSIGIDDTETYQDLDDGSHQVELLGVPDNCSVSSNPRMVNVPAGGAGSTTFSVTCVEETGSVQVSATTTGPDQDDEYSVTLSDGQGTMTLPANGSTTFTVVPTGSYTVTLSGNTANCTDDDGDFSEPVTVTLDATAQVTFSLTCTETDGSIAVDVTTSGDDQDTNGYDITLNGGSPRSVGPNGSTTYTNLTPDDYDVGIDETTVESNCTVNESNPQTATVTAGNTENVSFTVTCTETTGSIEVTTTTNGLTGDYDPDGYQVSSDDGPSFPIGANETVTLTEVTPGSRTVTLSDIEGICTAASANPVMVSVTAGDTATVGFTVDCL